jgi:hypothetical protein
MDKDFYYDKSDSTFPSGTKKNTVIKERVNLITSHMYKQYLEHVKASKNTTDMFSRMLSEMVSVGSQLSESFVQKNAPSSNIFCETDADRSVGIMNILWHSISFTTRGNTKPQALYRKGKQPLFCGRILALNGDFRDASLGLQDQEYPAILKCEIASLFVPADPTFDAIIKIKHLGNSEFLINQIDAPREFLLKVVEIICGGGYYHEEAEQTEES